MPEPLLTVKDVAAMLQCSVSTVHRLTKDGLLPLATAEQHQPGEYRRYRRQDILEYLAARRESVRPTTRLSAAILSTWPTETARALQTATLAGWAAGQNYAVVAVTHTLPDALRLIWEGSIEAIIVESLAGIATPDARELFTALCTQAGVKLIEAGTTTPSVDPAEQVLKFAANTLRDLLALVVGPAEAARIVEYSLQQWQHTLQRLADAGLPATRNAAHKHPPPVTKAKSPFLQLK